MKKLQLSILILLAGSAAFSDSWIITNSGFSFSPATITIRVGDDVTFNLESFHNAIEVSQATWNANGNTALSGGFQIAFGGGPVPLAQLEIGTHYYVCQPHAGQGMKGTIIVQSATDLPDSQAEPELSLYPNPTSGFITVKGGSTVIGARYLISGPKGEQVSKGKILQESTLIDISNLNPGIYILRLEGRKNQSLKVIKK